MSDPTESAQETGLLSVTLASPSLGVSYLSALLRSLQVAIREVGMKDDASRRGLERRPPPALVLHRLVGNGEYTLQFAFANPSDSALLPSLSSRVFDAFLDTFSDYVKGLPQPGLWGGAARRSSSRPYESDLAMRMDQVYRELQRCPRATLVFRGRTIEIEGDRMEIG